MMDSECDWRGRMEAVLAGQEPDIIPTALRLDKWYAAREAQGDIPGEISSCGSLDEVYRRLGIAHPARTAKVCDWVLRSPVEFEQEVKGEFITTKWHTPQGDLQMVQKHIASDKVAGLNPCTFEYPLKSFDDYPAYKTVLGHTECVPAYDSYDRYDRQIGTAGLPMVILGPIPFHDWLGHWAGYEAGYIQLYDRPDIVLDAVEVANRTYRKMWDIVAASPARLVMHGVNFDKSTTPPPVYRKYFLPYLSDFCELMHSAGKFVACHADGDNINLLEMIEQTGFDVADCFACAPMVGCTIEQARRTWRDRITIWGGVPSTLLEPSCSTEQLQDHLDYLYCSVAPGDHFIMGIADQVMPTATWEHLSVFLSNVKKRQHYPIRT